jgi:toxin ParE1/3/4
VLAVRVKWLRAALADVDAVVDCLAGDNPAAADRMAGKIEHSVEQLADDPAMGRAGRVVGTRELVISGTPYVVAYRVRQETIEVLCIFHAARRWPSEF